MCSVERERRLRRHHRWWRDEYGRMSGLLVGTGAIVVASALAHGTWYRNSPIFGPVLARLPARLPGSAPRIALTFDDGPNPDATPRILDALAASDVKATFFLLGKHVDQWPHIAARVAAEGHTIGNHGWHHRKLHVKSPHAVREDLIFGADSIARATGVRPTFFRAPHGFRSPWVNPIAHSLGQCVVGWSLGVWDSARPGAAAITRRTLDGITAGSIVLLHDGDGYDPAGDRSQTAEAVPCIVAGLLARGYELVALTTTRAPE